ncbi:MAG: septum formation protein Maf [Armatimonadetes bacterium]|nr:septum formation protein Maf [Armatimonadota bacterium]
MTRLILASSSPRRRELLHNLKAAFEVVAPEEEIEPPLPPRCAEDQVPELACSTALTKAVSVARRVEAGSLVLAADTMVLAGERLLGKPQTREEAAAILELLSASRHAVITGVAVVETGSGRQATGYERTEVVFNRLDPQDIRDYVDSGEPFDKAGAYGIQGLGGLLVARIEGCYFNVVGLPLSRVDRLLRGFGLRLLRPG